MLKLVLMVTIVPRKNSEKMISFFKNNNIAMTLGRYGRGTASDSMLNMLGIAEKEKCIAFSIVSLGLAESILKTINKELKDNFTFFIPITSIGGNGLMDNIEKEITAQPTESFKFTDELILVIINRGFVETVMEIARKAGAPGGTVIHARGTGSDSAEKFFGVTVGAEKEMIFIVTEREKRDTIMKAIMQYAGNSTPAGAVLFSLPVKK